MLPQRADAGTAAGNRRRTEVRPWNQRGARKRAPLLQNDLSGLARTFSSRGGLDLSPIARIDRATIYKMLLPSSLVVSPRKDTRCWSYCGRRARPFLGRALREQGTSTGALPPPLTFPSFPIAHRIHARRPCNGCNPIRP